MKLIFAFLGILAVSVVLSAGCISDDSAASAQIDIDFNDAESGADVSGEEKAGSSTEPVDSDLVEFGDLI